VSIWWVAPRGGGQSIYRAYRVAYAARFEASGVKSVFGMLEELRGRGEPERQAFFKLKPDLKNTYEQTTRRRLVFDDAGGAYAVPTAAGAEGSTPEVALSRASATLLKPRATTYVAPIRVNACVG
jgi:hypothetical protein